MSVFRTLLYTLLAATALAVVIFPNPEREGTYDSNSHRMNFIRASLRFDLQSELLRREDSRQRALASLAQPRASGLTIVSGPGVTPAFLERARTALAAIAEERSRDTAVRVIATLVVDTGRTLDGVPVHRHQGSASTDVFMPGTLAPNVCAMVIRAGTGWILNPPRNRTQQGLGINVAAPCWWYARYGVPGRGVASWLDTTRAAALAAGGSGQTRHLNESGLSTLLWNNRQFRGCANGGGELCESLLLSPQISRNGTSESVLRGWWGNGRPPRWVWARTLGGALLGSIHDHLGEDRFAAFWKSDEPVPVSFASISGEPLGEFFYKLVTADSALAHRPHPSHPLRPGSLVTVLVGIATCIGAGVYGMMRRGSFA